ncbi:MAG: hypothetical protein V2B20_27625 [Pseudomonadota bacterium]
MNFSAKRILGFLPLLVFGLAHPALCMPDLTKALLGGEYSFNLIVLDADERYPATIKLKVTDDGMLANGMVDYPSYKCKAIIANYSLASNHVELTERIVDGTEVCTAGRYDLEIKASNLYSPQGNVETVTAVSNGQSIPTILQSHSFSSSPYSKFRIQYKVAVWEEIAVQPKQVLLEYLDILPESTYRNKTISAIYKYAQNENSWAALAGFLSKFPTAPESADAKKAMYQMTLASDKMADYFRFLDFRPALPVQTEMLSKAATLLVTSNTLPQYDEFLAKLTNLPDDLKQAAYDTVMRAREPLFFERAQATGTAGAFQAYLYQYPTDYHAVEARSQLDKLLWALATGKDTIPGYREFLNLAKEDTLRQQAVQRIEKLETMDRQRVAKLQVEEQERYRKQEEERQRRQEELRRAYLVEKNVGDKVCKDGAVALGIIKVTVTAFVEQKRGDRIQLRIFSTDGQSIQYNGGGLHQDAIIWDDSSSWRVCL